MEKFHYLHKRYKEVKHIIQQRIEEFDKLWWEKKHSEIFYEFIFCLLTPQSKAQKAWQATLTIIENRTLYTGSCKDIQPFLKGVRFYKKKACYIVENRDKFYVDGHFLLIDMINENDLKKTRKHLVNTVKGYGYKEASHFLRNIGLYKNIAILDRHILKNMVKYGYIEKIPASLTPKKYLEIEKKFMEFSQDIGIPSKHLDLLLWYMEANEVFK